MLEVKTETRLRETYTAVISQVTLYWARIVGAHALILE